MKRYFAPRVLLVSSAIELAVLYEEAKFIPNTTTRENVTANSGIIINGPLSVTSGRSSFLIGFYRDEGYPCVVKCSPTIEGITHENSIWESIGKEGIEHHLAGPLSLLILGPDRQNPSLPNKGLLMPYYAASLEQIPSPISILLARKVIACIGDALKFIHTKDIAHLDVKPSNIFVNWDGEFFLGDFGAACKVGSTPREYGGTHFPSDLPKISSPNADNFMLVATILDKLKLLDVLKTPSPKTADIIQLLNTIGDKDLKEDLSKLLVDT